MSDSEIEEEEFDLSDETVVTKYKAAADIANRTIVKVIAETIAGKSVVELCALGDKSIEEAVKLVYNKGKIEKGSAFPTCISVNNCVGHNSPLDSEASQILADGDVVKIDLGVHIDGFIAVVAHTVIVGSTAEQPVTGRKADVICAAHFAAEAALRLVKPGKTNTEVTETINKIAEIYHCNLVEGVLSHQMKRFVIDGNKVIISKSNLEQKVDEITFEENEVYAIDIVVSSGEGKPKETESRTTVFKRAVDQNYMLKLKASKYVLSEINQKFPTLPFSLRALDEKKGRLGIIECLKHDLVHPYPVLYEKQGEFVAHFKFTVLILPTQTMKITGADLSLPHVSSQYKIEDAKINSILALGTKRMSNAKKNKKKKGPKPAEVKPATEAPAAEAPASS